MQLIPIPPPFSWAVVGVCGLGCGLLWWLAGRLLRDRQARWVVLFSYGVRVFVGVALSLVSSVTGLYVSYHAGIATGAAIVLVATGLFTVALLLAPRRGLLSRWLLDRSRRLEQASP